LELIKGREFDEALSSTLLHVLGQTLAVAHPIIPFVTEELWGHLPSAEGLLAAARLPAATQALIDDDAERVVGDLIETVRALRGWRESAGLPPGERLPARLPVADTAALVGRLARLDLEAAVEGDPTASLPVPGGAAELWAAVDPEEEQRKLAARRSELESEIARAHGKLANDGFVAKAPAAVVQAERDKLERLQRELDAL
jgi:valyl-tRNA synthetase